MRRPLVVDGRRVRRIVVSRLRFLGDVILTTPLLRALKRADPEVRIAYLVETAYAPVLQHHPCLDELWTIERKAGGIRQELTQMLRLRQRMRAFRPDATIDLLGMPRSAILLRLSGAPIRIGGPYRIRRHLYTHVVEHTSPQVSAMHYHLENLEPLGISGPFSPEELRTKVALLPEERHWAQDFLNRFVGRTDRVVGLHPGATWPAKRWFPERFAQLARSIRDELAIPVVLTVGPGEEELADRVAEFAGGAALRLPVLGLRQLAAVLAQLDAYVSNDCGPMHLAVAVGTPTVGLFGPGEPEIWFPYSRNEGHTALHHPCPIHPCHRDFCDDLVCFRDLGVQEVLEAVEWAINRKNVATSFPLDC